MFIKGAIGRFLNRKKTEKAGRDYWLRQTAYNYQAIFPDRYDRQIAFTDRALFSRMQATDRVIDLGCADGWHSLVIAARAALLHGYDLSEAFVALARKGAADAGLTNCTFTVADALTLKLRTASAEVFIMSGLTTYFVDDADALKVMAEANQALVPGGLILFKDTLTKGPETELNVSNEYGAICRDRGSYLRLIRKSGFEPYDEAWIDDGAERASLMVAAKKV